jgi:hypothetical protein
MLKTRDPSVADLKDELRAFGLGVTGNKSVLAQRLMQERCRREGASLGGGSNSDAAADSPALAATQEPSGDGVPAEESSVNLLVADGNSAALADHAGVALAQRPSTEAIAAEASRDIAVGGEHAAAADQDAVAIGKGSTDSHLAEVGETATVDDNPAAVADDATTVGATERPDDLLAHWKQAVVATDAVVADEAGGAVARELQDKLLAGGAGDALVDASSSAGADDVTAVVAKGTLEHAVVADEAAGAVAGTAIVGLFCRGRLAAVSDHAPATEPASMSLGSIMQDFSDILHSNVGDEKLAHPSDFKGDNDEELAAAAADRGEDELCYLAGDQACT